MHIAELLTVERVSCCAQAASKKRALEQLATLIAQAVPALGAGEIFDSLIARERLGSTGLGHGVAIPHGRPKGNTQAAGALLKLTDGVDFDAVDGQPVDLLFALLVPEQSTDEHLQLLAQLAEMFSDHDFVQRLRACPDAPALYDLIRRWQPRD